MKSALRPGRAILSTNLIGGLIGPRKYLDNMEKSKILTLLGIDLRTHGCPAGHQLQYGLRYFGFLKIRDYDCSFEKPGVRKFVISAKFMVTLPGRKIGFS
jgi:hypothetical protein